ncbi:MAG TPA: hypothetical protein VFG69_01145, partial [Nannocystaceae bacterium]|nr:hypothetical protein [Nannocystaceae bacterium]
MDTSRRCLVPALGLALSTLACGDDGAAADHGASDDPHAADDDGAQESGDAGDTTHATSEGSSACDVVPPATWEAAGWDASTAEALALRAGLDALVGEMRRVEQGKSTLDDVQALVDLYEAGAPSVSSIATSGHAPVVQEAFAELVEIAAAGPRDLVDDDGQWTPGPAGGIYGTDLRGIDEGGLEVRQLVDKGLFAGGLYGYAAGLTTGTIDEATIDALAAAWGGNSTLDPEGELTDSASYTHQMGFHADVVAALVAAKAYSADAECEAERDEALRTFFRTWELAMFARLVYYSNVGVTAVETATIDDDFAGALHEQSEGLGLALGFYGLAHPETGPLAGAGRVATDAQLDAIAAALGV